MNEVDRLYNEWREEQRVQAEHTRRYCVNAYVWYNNYNKLPEYIRACVVLETSEALNEFLKNNKNDLCNYKTNRTNRLIKYAEEELEMRANKRSELAAKVSDAQSKTRKETFLEQPAEQNELDSGFASAIMPFGCYTVKTKTIKTEGKNTMEKTVNVNTKIDIATLIQAKMAEKMMDAVGDGKDIPLTKLMIMQSLANGGSIDVTELIRTKQTEKLLKDLNENKDLSIGKLLTYQALTGEGGFDVNALIQAQFVEKLFADDEKEK